jgi:large subunit ribosomal protein L2
MRFYRPLTPSLRQLCLIDHTIFSKRKIVRTFNFSDYNKAGRNHHGHITVRHHGGGVKKIYTYIDMFNRIFNIPFTIKSINYDAFRSSFISLVMYANGLISYRTLVYKNFINDILFSYNILPENLKNGDSCLLKYISPGAILCNIELIPNLGSQLSRSAGSSSLLLKKDETYAYLKLSSNKIIQISIYCLAFLGSISNRNSRYINLGKAGRSRYLNIRPTVRGVAMNPVDHPHGGGEGKKSKKSYPRSPWGKQRRLPAIRLLLK